MIAKYRIKNNTTEPVDLFLKTRKKSSASTKQSTIFNPSAISVIKTLLPGSEWYPLKKIKSAMKAVRVKPAVRKAAAEMLKREGKSLPTTISMMMKKMAMAPRPR
ncbi:MAG TPA: hypothetical protein PL067_05935 [Bacteroidales bacterium]|nr:hypothetical protein [Bacteroidales bacterium]HQL45943.1 hypothetical protein [Bacteroidales bacterium]